MGSVYNQRLVLCRLFTDDRVCLIDIEADGIQIIEKSDFKEDYLLSPTEEDMVKFRATLEKLEVGLEIRFWK